MDPITDTTQNGHMGTACDILSLHFTALPSHHKTQQLISRLYTPQNPFHITPQETGSLPLPAPFLHEFFLLLITHFPSSLFQISDIFFLLPIDRKPHIQWQTQNPPLSTSSTATKQKGKKKIQPSTTTIKRKKFQSSIPPPTTQTHLHQPPPPVFSHEIFFLNKKNK